MNAAPETCPNCFVDLYGSAAQTHDCKDLRLREVWDILVTECGAIKDPQSGHGFVSFAYYFGDSTDHSIKEFRFMGDLGRGGKVWHRGHSTQPIDVNYYSEDQTPERDEMERRANERLAELFR